MTNTASKIFKYRSYTPIPFIIIMLIYENANIWSLIAGFLIAFTGELIRLWGVSWAGSETRTTGGVGGSFLVISGPFAFVRNPLYIGNILIYTGIGIMSFAVFPWLQVIGFIFFLFQYHVIVKEEEKFLMEKYQAEYDNYRRHVPRFFPRLTPYRNKNLEQPSFNLKKGLSSEKRTFQALGFVSVTIFLLWFIGRV
jgi:protein-S-isoprenylcysteine O-methyltransferase Ste14